ncbi:hypothetical protein LCGC14_1517000 [marine sediment metagenome]|uniref:Uncharacterized protein n=1 Tax=marine sediment metagenome TaxID=412755 RepID=A0A0F9JKJ9_9ZZZZ
MIADEVPREKLIKRLHTAEEKVKQLQEIEKRARDLFDNRLGWSDGRNPYAPKEFWKQLGQVLRKVR